MTRKAVQILQRHDLSVTEIDHLEDRLYNHNRRATGRHDGKNSPSWPWMNAADR
jgi:hypothetical protein